MCALYAYFCGGVRCVLILAGVRGRFCVVWPPCDGIVKALCQRINKMSKGWLAFGCIWYHALCLAYKWEVKAFCDVMEFAVIMNYCVCVYVSKEYMEWEMPICVCK